ncbi:Ig-like domain-containing protein [Acidovorax sp. M2(2025)]|uniref:Ig-like domain-containing protein n=1 Tax=Acidovorax sp. M2(2025) TaxID=3411355 RepID=UPI003BF554BC
MQSKSLQESSGPSGTELSAPEEGSSASGRLLRPAPSALVALGLLVTAASQTAKAGPAVYDQVFAPSGGTISGSLGTNDNLDPAQSPVFQAAPAQVGTFTLTDTATGAFSYVAPPNPGDTVMNDWLGYSLVEGSSSSSASVSIQINPANPQAQPDAATTVADKSVTIFPLSNDIGVQLNTANVIVDLSLLVQPQHGMVVRNPDESQFPSGPASFVYYPDPGFTGVDRFYYSLLNTDGAALYKTSFAPVSVTVNSSGGATNPPVSVPPSPPAPVGSYAAADDAYGLYAGQYIQANVKGNDDFHPSVSWYSIAAGADADVDGILDPGSTPAHAATFTMDFAGRFLYEPQPGFFGTDQFKYELRQGWVDSQGASHSSNTFATVNITVLSRVVDDVASVVAGQQLSAGVAPNDRLAGMVSGQFHSTSQPAHGQLVSFDPNTGAYVYVPDPAYVGVDEFLYELEEFDAQGKSLAKYPGKVTITVTAAPPVDPPVTTVRPVPALSGWGAASLSALLAGMGVWVPRRRNDRTNKRE